MAAWALSFRTTNAAVRIPCLYRAALGDPSPRVRMSAVQALGGLSDDLAPAYHALVQLTADEAPADVRSLSVRILATDATHARRHDEAELGAFFSAAKAGNVR
jgi:hypothetical protein